MEGRIGESSVPDAGRIPKTRMAICSTGTDLSVVLASSPSANNRPVDDTANNK